MSRKMKKFFRRKFTESKSEETHYYYSVKIIFMVSRSADGDIMSLLGQEADTFQDLVISDNQESYSNLPLKTLALMNYYIDYCKNSKYLVKVDQDVFLRVPLLLKYLDGVAAQDFTLGGRLNVNQIPNRQPTDKYSVSRTQYSSEKYPPFLSGISLHNIS